MLDQSDLDLVLSGVGDDPTPAEPRQREPALSSVWIGSGLAKIPALHGASVLQKSTGAASRFMTSLDYARNPLVTSLPVLVSLRGNHVDAVAVARSIVARQCPNGVLLTGDPNGGAGTILRHAPANYRVVSAPLPTWDRRFVNCKSIFMLSVLSHRLAASCLPDPGSAWLRADRLEAAWAGAKECALRFGGWLQQTGADRPGPLIILGDGMPSALSLAWQAVLSEAGVVTPVCLDIKDYTHGDHAAAGRTGNASYIVLSHSGIADICQRFTRHFSSLYDVFVVNLASDPVHLFWENLFTVCNVTSIWTGLLGYPDQRPPKHPVMSHWRDWGELVGHGDEPQQ